ncbi:MAG: type I-B CRISPR-associated endonuclease Cas1, partial [Clostridiaceae bacterium]|nr:type I-B CRISPR-associated endonuclease Cas1 [Clostridiaceae bacterium]
MKKSAYIFNNGKISRKDNTVLFESEEGKKYLPIEDISEIYIFGEVTVTKKFLEFATQKEILLHFFNYNEYYCGTYYPREHYNSGYMILKQAEYYMDEVKRNDIALRILKGSALNILTVLKYYKNRGKDVEAGIQDIDNLLLSLNDEQLRHKNISQAMAIEGNIRDLYYKNFDKIIEDSDFAFEKRTRQPPLNKLNSLVSFGNSVLYTIVLSEIYNTHLDPRIGFLHTTNNRRFTLNLDIAEIFKPILVDRTIFTLIGKKMLNSRHFDKKMDGIYLNDQGKKIFINELNNKLASTLSYKPLGRSVSYKRLIRLELYKLEKHIIG